jgi:hypothetical protein
VFIEDAIILHALDEATRFSMATVIPDKKTHTIINAMTAMWFRYFGAPK